MTASAGCAPKTQYQPVCDDSIQGAPQPTLPDGGSSVDGGCNVVTKLTPAPSALYVLWDKTSGMRDFFGGKAFSTVLGLSLGDPAFKQTQIALKYTPGLQSDCSVSSDKNSFGTLPKAHAVDRLASGFDLDNIVTEYGLLRRAILDRWESRIGPMIDLGELRNLDTALDELLRQAALRYAEAREKLLKALDRISEAALGTGDLDTFLQTLLRATLESTESVDTAVMLLREGDTLRVRAAVGLEDGVD